MSGDNIMNNKIFKSLQYSNCYMNTSQFNIFDVTIPCNSVIYIDVCENTMYICSRFPNYSGDAKNVILNVTWYDYEMHTIGTTTIKNCDASIALFEAWKSASMPHVRKIRHEMTMRDYEKMMKHDRKKKSGSGGVRLSAKSDEYTTDSLRYKQVTEPAYWASMGIGYNGRPCTNSGNASVVASNIR